MDDDNHTFTDDDNAHLRVEVVDLSGERYLELAIWDGSSSKDGADAELFWIPAAKVEEVILAIAKVAAPLVASDDPDTVSAAGG